MTKNESEKKPRLFIGTYINPDLIHSNNDLEKLSEYFNCSMKFTEKHNLHLTWKFIGAIEQEKIDQINCSIQNAVFSPFSKEIKFERFEIWPNGKFPRQLVLVGNDITTDGSKLYKSINAELAKIGIEKEKRAFNPHITIARFRIKQKLPQPLTLPGWLKFEETVVDFTNLELIQSQLTPKGSIYSTIKSFSL